MRQNPSKRSTSPPLVIRALQAADADIQGGDLRQGVLGDSTDTPHRGTLYRTNQCPLAEGCGGGGLTCLIGTVVELVCHALAGSHESNLSVCWVTLEH